MIIFTNVQAINFPEYYCNNAVKNAYNAKFNRYNAVMTMKMPL